MSKVYIVYNYKDMCHESTAIGSSIEKIAESLIEQGIIDEHFKVTNKSTGEVIELKDFFGKDWKNKFIAAFRSLMEAKFIFNGSNYNVFEEGWAYDTFNFCS